MSKLDDQVEALFQALPADTYEEIRLGMQRILGHRLSKGIVNNTIHAVRTHDEYSWTVPYTKRGSPRVWEKKRLFAIKVDRDGDPKFDEEQRAHFDKGGLTTIQTIHTHCENYADMLEVSLQYESSIKKRELLRELQEDTAFLARKSARILRFMQAS